MSDYNSRQIIPSPSPDFSPQLLPSTPYTFINPPHNAATTVAINLRQFEKDSKAQAEREYDAEHGPLPEPPADDDHTIPDAERSAQKKKRKVRSAIVSRRKTAIYVTKLEDALKARDHSNASLASQVGVIKEVLRETVTRIEKLTRMLHARQEPPQKRLRTTPPVPRTGPSTESHPHPFFLDPDTGSTFDDLLSVSPEDIAAVGTRVLPSGYSETGGHEGGRTFQHNGSECSDGQLTPKHMPYPTKAQDLSRFSIRDDSGYRSSPVVFHPATALPNHHIHAPVAM